MKPQVLRRVASENVFYETIIYGKYSMTVSAVESWNEIQKQLKDTLLKYLSPIFILNHINSLLIMQKK